MDYIEEHIHDDITRTDINYEQLMYNYRNELGDLLYEMNNHGDELFGYVISFFGDKAKTCFESLLLKYIDIHFDTLCL